MVKTGVYKDGAGANHADYVVEDFEEAWRLILELEGLLHEDLSLDDDVGDGGARPGSEAAGDGA